MEHPGTQVREISLEEAISIAILLQKNEQLTDAQDLYRRILALAPNHPDALHYSGVLAHQQGRSNEALALIEKSLELEPNQADWYNNLGIVLRDRGRLDDAIAAYRRAISLNPDHADAYSNLGVLLRAQGRPADAEAAYRTAIRLNPDHFDAYTNLGVLLSALGRTDEVVTCYYKLLTLRPKHPDARRLLAQAHGVIGERDKAVAILEEWLQDEPDNPIARHMLAACSGQAVPARASDEYVEKTFDRFAASFDSKLAKLSYRAPALVAAMVESSEVEPSKSLDVLDAGCGTGLCGPLLARFARRLVGVDLSAGMLAQAQAKSVYDELVKGELTTYLGACDESFDLIISADTLCYFGALEGVLTAAAAALRPNGLLIFTLEDAMDSEAVTRYRLEPHGRYCHGRQYVESVLADAGLVSNIVQADLRMEALAPVAGLVIRGTKPAHPGDPVPRGSVVQS